jgi:hypothetical protein
LHILFANLADYSRADVLILELFLSVYVRIPYEISRGLMHFYHAKCLYIIHWQGSLNEYPMSIVVGRVYMMIMTEK